MFRKYTLEVIASILSLLIKYDIRHIRPDVLRLVSQVFPVTFDDWERCRDPKLNLEACVVDIWSPESLIRFIDTLESMPGSLMDALLPSAYLRVCTTIPLEYILSIEMPKKTGYRLLVGRSKILSEFSRFTVWRHPCTSRCQTYRNAWWSSVLQTMIMDNLSPLVDLSAEELDKQYDMIPTAADGQTWSPHDLCSDCKAKPMSVLLMQKRSERCYGTISRLPLVFSVIGAIFLANGI